MKKTSALTIAFAATVVAANAAVFMDRSGSKPGVTPTTSVGLTPFKSRILPTADKTAAKLGPRKGAPRRAKAKDVPFVEDFTTADNLGDWGIQDINGDNSSWEYKESFGLVRIYYPAAGQERNDDWLVTPAINLGKDDVYTLTFSYGSQGTRYKPEQLTVTMGTSEYAPATRPYSMRTTTSRTSGTGR